MPRNCIVENCNKRAGYGCYESTIYCLEHSVGEIINFNNYENNDFVLNTYKMCGKRYCKEFAEYNYKLKDNNLLEASFCINHINNRVRNYRTKAFKKCSNKLCNKKSEFGPEDSSSCVCIDCNKLLDSSREIIKLPKVIMFQTCSENKCTNIGTFGTKISKTPCLCEEHSIGDMYDINNKYKICIYISDDKRCKTRASYGYDGDKITYCKEHKLEEMIDLNARKCDIDGCITQPVFGFENERANRCSKHKEESMIDVRSIICEVEDCKIRASFGFGTADRCSYHKEEGMFVAYKSIICNEENCLKTCCYGFEGEKPVKCYEHKKEHMINVKSIKCNNCNKKIMSLRYNPNCYECFAELNPNHGRVIEHKTKENYFTLKLKEIYKDAVLDSQINYVSKHRPDFILFLENHTIIVEIDERQHNRLNNHYYNKENNNYRLDCLRTYILNPLYLIRFNPDNYRKKGILIEGCFKYSKTNNRQLIKVEEEYIIRLNKLLETVNRYANISIDKLPKEKDYLEEIYLFYNE